MTLQQTFDLLQQIYEQLLATHNSLDDDFSPDTSHAIRQACGYVSRARNMVYRNIEYLRSTAASCED